MKELKLENFRCYTEQTIPLRPGVNLLIGDNASGKTSVLKACKYVISSFFVGFSDENTKFISPGVDDFNMIEKDGVILPEKPIVLEFVSDESHASYQLRKKSKKNRSSIAGMLSYRDYAKSLHNNFINDQQGQIQALPLWAGFTTGDIHASRKIKSKKFQSYAQKSSFGYYECLAGEGFLPYWLKRLLILQEGQKNQQEIDIVRQAIKAALGADGCNIIQNMQIRPNQKKVYYIFMDGREVEAEQLSDGYRRLVNIVTDLAFRCALLNRGIYGLESAERTKGTVLIDEIDLHLHPKLQVSVLKGLRNAFPQLQFIVTTHAPMVMTGVESNEENVIYKLNYSIQKGYTVTEIQTYGLDVSTITEIILDQIPRDLEAENKLNTLFDLIDNDDTTNAKLLLGELKNRFGDNLPELVRAEAMLNFTIEDDEKD
jgi:predicted ATP-binding protein involved in virulence